MRLTFLLLLVTAGVLLGAVGSVHAQDFGTRARLDYQATESCPDEGAFTDQVAARLGFIPFREDASQTVRVRLMTDGDSWMGTAEVGEASPRLMRGPRCEDVARDLAAAVAVILVPEPPEPEPEPEQKPQGDVVGGAAPPAPPSGPPGTVPVRFSITSDAGLVAPAIHVQTGTASAVGSARSSQGRSASIHMRAEVHDRLCTMPCEARLAPETYQFAVSSGRDAPWNLPALVGIDGPSRVHIDHESYEGTRNVGGVFLILGLITAAASPGLLLFDVDVLPTLGVAGAGLGVMMVGVAITSTADEVGISVTPL